MRGRATGYVYVYSHRLWLQSKRQSSVIVKVNSFGNKLELERRGEREMRLRCVRFNAGREEGR